MQRMKLHTLQTKDEVISSALFWYIGDLYNANCLWCRVTLQWEKTLVFLEVYMKDLVITGI